MSWGDPNSAAARAVIRRARKGLDTPARRRALMRAARDPHTKIEVVAEDEAEIAEDEEGNE